jgi:hypothetical protein
MTYRIDLSQRADGMDIAAADWGGQRLVAASRNGAHMALARTLCDSGAPDGPWTTFAPGSDAARTVGASLHRLADLTIRETTSGKGSLKVAKWQPYPTTASGDEN